MKAVMDISQNAYRAMTPAFSPFEFVQRKDSPRADRPVTPPVASAGERSRDQAKSPNAPEVEELKRRLAELETLVSGLAPKKAARKKK
jgi:hypothetical protein